MSSQTFLEKYGPWALITGASSGIGAEFCRQLAAKGLNIVLAARRVESMKQIAGELENKHNIKTKVVQVDLSTRDFMDTLAPEISTLEIGLLVNNAGFGISGSLLTASPDKERELVNVNCRAPLILTQFIGNSMMKRKKGGIILLSSVLGFTASPWFANYAASKAYNLHLGRALWSELKPYGIDVAVLAPGSTDTEFNSISGIKGLVSMNAGPVVKTALKKLGRKPVIVTGAQNRFAVLLIKLLPARVLVPVTGHIINYLRKSSKDQQ